MARLPGHRGLGQGWPLSTWPDYNFTLRPRFHLGSLRSMNDLFIQVTPEWANTTCYLSGDKPAFQRHCLPNGGILGPAAEGGRKWL